MSKPVSYQALPLLLATQKSLLRKYSSVFKKQGDVVHYQLFNKNFYFIKHPTFLKHILLDNNSNYVKGEQFDAFTQLLGNGLLSARDAEHWKTQRHEISSFFSNKNLERYVDAICANTLEITDAWEKDLAKNSIVNITQTIEKLAFRIVTKTILNLNKTSTELDEAYADLNFTFNYLGSRLTPLDKITKLRGYSECQKKLARLEKFVAQIIADAEKNNPHNPFIEKILAANASRSLAEARKQVRDEIMTIFLTGYETVSTLLIWTFIILSKYPGIERNLCNEFNSVLNGRLPTYDDLPKLIYTKAVIKETLRLYPPGWIVARQAVADDMIENQKIHKNSNIILFIYFLHQHPEFWTNPQGFDPERFLNNQLDSKYIYCPFGMGPRSCIGGTYAIMEATLILATILQKFQLELLPGFNAEPIPGLTLKPASGDLLMRLRRRT